MASMLMMAMTSCVNENIGGGIFNSKTGVADLDEQSAAVETSLNAIDEIQGSLSEYADNGRVKGLEAALNNLSAAETALENHIAYLEGGVSLLDGTMATLAMQKQLAEAVGEVEGSLMLSGVEVKSINKQFNALEESVKDWIGKSYEMLYGAVEADTKVQYLLSDLEGKLFNQKVSVGGLLSDIEAGLRDKEFYAELSSLSETVESNETVISELERSVSGIADQLEIEYGKAIEAVATSSTEYDFDALAKLNEGAGVTLLESSVSLDDLVARIQQCEADIESLKERLGVVEGNVAELLELIQSVAFVSEYADDKAVACYELDLEGTRDAEDKCPRTPVGDITLNYIVRPAAAVTALADMQNWATNGVSMAVKAYYAEKISTASFDKELLDFDIKSVSGDSNTGILTLTVDPSKLDENFYMKRTGARLALSLQVDTDKDTEIETDITSKFVEIIPVDNSGKVYVETLELSSDYIELDFGTTSEIIATVTPANATEIGVEWESGNITSVTIDENGKINGAALGNAVITATTKSTDEWGRTLTDTCHVKVVPIIKLSGSTYVEKGGNIIIRIESPDYIDPESVSWESNAPTMVSIEKQDDGSARVEALASYYSTTNKEYDLITITCNIENTGKFTYDIRAIEVQPKGIAIEDLSSGQNALTLKKGQGYTFTSTVQPAEVDMKYFRLIYQSNNKDVVYVPDMNSGYVVAGTIGSATVSVKVTDQGQYNYFYPKRNELVRNVDVTVEPYYVETVTIDSPVQLSPGADPVILPVTFTSDVGGKAPTFTGVKWSMSEEDAAKGVISLDPETGMITPLAEGNVTVIATTYEDGAVPSGSAHKSGQCVVMVRTQQNPVVVGGYYYSDGTWGTEAQPSGKSVIGVIFSTASAVLGDSMLSSDGYSACVNGLAVSTVEYTSKFGYISTGYTETGKWFINKGYDNINTTKPNGYSNTKGLILYDAEKDPNQSNSDEAVARIPAAHAAVVSKPESASTWYIPSYYEMSLLYQNMSDVNSALSAVSGAQISASDYWSSSLQWTTDSHNDILSMYPFSMQSGGWAASANKYNQLPVRVVLAF